MGAGRIAGRGGGDVRAVAGPRSTGRPGRRPGVAGRGHDGRVLAEWLDDWLDDWLDLGLGGGCVGCGRPGRLLCARCRSMLPTEPQRVRPQPCPDGLAPAFAAAEYADLVRRMILLHKERQVFGLARPLGHLLAAAIRVGTVPGARTLLVPVPSRPAVVRARGHDPTGALTSRAARLAGATAVPLLRTRPGLVDQAGLDAAQRALESVGLRVAAVAAVAVTRRISPGAALPPSPGTD